MRRLRAAAVRLANLFRRGRLDRDLAAEIDSHLQLHVDDNLRAGMSPEEARRQAIIALGGMQQVTEQYRDRRGLPWLEALLADVRFAVRVLRKQPAFTLAAVSMRGRRGDGDSRPAGSAHRAGNRLARRMSSRVRFEAVRPAP